MKEPVLLPPGDLQTQEFKSLVKGIAPSRPIIRNALVAFFVGGSISLISQFFLGYWMGQGTDKKLATGLTSLVIVLLGSFLTGLGVYDKIGRVAGMGSALPISGFANSMTSPAMDSKREGWVLGVGSKMFIIAGPVVVYGLISAALVSAAVFLYQGVLR